MQGAGGPVSEDVGAVPAAGRSRGREPGRQDPTLLSTPQGSSAVSSLVDLLSGPWSVVWSLIHYV